MQDVPDVSPLEGTEGQRAWSEYLQRHRDDLDDTEGFTLYNEAFYIDKEGVRGRYHKLNLWHPEREYLAQGKKKFPVFDTPWGKAGFLICECWATFHGAAGMPTHRA
jgi:predicted amidohydrolase